MPPGNVDGEALLTQQVLRGLGDKLYDKRKLAALEVEQLVKNLAREVRPELVILTNCCKALPVSSCSPRAHSCIQLDALTERLCITLRTLVHQIWRSDSYFPERSWTAQYKSCIEHRLL